MGNESGTVKVTVTCASHDQSYLSASGVRSSVSQRGRESLGNRDYQLVM